MNNDIDAVTAQMLDSLRYDLDRLIGETRGVFETYRHRIEASATVDGYMMRLRRLTGQIDAIEQRLSQVAREGRAA